MIEELGRRARDAARQLRAATSDTKNRALLLAADAVQDASAAILEANQADMETARSEGVTGALLDRQLLTPERIEGIAGGLRKVAALLAHRGRHLDLGLPSNR